VGPQCGQVLRVGMVDGGFMARTHSLADAAAAMLEPAGTPRAGRVRLADVTEDLAARPTRRRGASTPGTARTRVDPPGRGVVDFPRLREALTRNGFNGAATVEQDVDPTVGPDPLSDAVRSLEYLRGVGLADGNSHERHPRTPP
jgi:sugar phosphate isomerase/epimerase